MQPDFGDRARCFQPDVKPASTCPEEFVINPDNEQILVRSEALSRGGMSMSGGGYESGGTYYEEGGSQGSISGGTSGISGGSGSGGSSGSSSGGVVQISPQHVQLKLRISKLQKFQLSSES